MKRQRKRARKRRRERAGKNRFPAIAIISLQMKRCINYFDKILFSVAHRLCVCQCVRSSLSHSLSFWMCLNRSVSVHGIYAERHHRKACSNCKHVDGSAPHNFHSIVAFSADVCGIKLKLIKFLFTEPLFFPPALLFFRCHFETDAKIYLVLIL